MPRATKATKMNELLDSLPISRTVGLEIEGYMRDYPEQVAIKFAKIKNDGSLVNAWWYDRGRPYGVEVATDPLARLTQVNDVFIDIKKHGWSIGRGTAGLHIHVDASDFSLRDKVRTAYFAKRIEDVMFLFVKPYRYKSRYCHLLSAGWNGMMEAVPYHQTIWDVFRDIYSATNHYSLVVKFGQCENKTYRQIDIARYNWINVFSSKYPTIEFRLFNAIKDEIQGKQFAVLAYNFIETAKNCSFEHLMFIADSIEAEPDIKKKAEMLLTALNVPFTLPIIGTRAAQAIERSQQRRTQGQMTAHMTFQEWALTPEAASAF